MIKHQRRINDPSSGIFRGTTMGPFTNVKYVLLDIEGTVVPISFVKDTLFTFAREQLESFLESHWTEEPALKDAIRLIQEFSAGRPESPQVDGSKTSVISSVLWQMDRDVKHAGLKKLQSLIWKEGYETGQLKCELYEDVYEAFNAWKELHLEVGIYSSGAVAAQKDLFRCTERGSMLVAISSFHDLTTAGSKLETASYKKIASEIKREPAEILFLTDVYGEYKAAKEAGMESLLVLRPGNKPLTQDELESCDTISNFMDVKFR